MSYNNYKPYKSIAEIKEDAAKNLAKLRKKNPQIAPVEISGTKIARTWWGIAWNNNLESYADYENRISRGRSYVKNGMILDLQITRGQVSALVQGSRKAPYQVDIYIDKLPEEQWNDILKVCSNKIGSVSELLEGKFPKELAEVFMQQGKGLFPTPKEIHMVCKCPDWAGMCKHIAATLYGVGTRLDTDPTLFFTLRDINFEALLKKSAEEKMDSLLKNAEKESVRILKDANIEDLFGLEK